MEHDDSRAIAEADPTMPPLVEADNAGPVEYPPTNPGPVDEKAWEKGLVAGWPG